VTFASYALAGTLSDPSLARNRALSTADFLYAKVKVNWKIVSVSTRSQNRVTVTTTALRSPLQACRFVSGRRESGDTNRTKRFSCQV